MRQLLSRSSYLILFALVICFSLPVAAQFRASVAGSVTDEQGGTIPAATVTLLNKETSRSQQTTTNDSGYYQFSQLPPGTYTITVEHAGFKKQFQDNVLVNAEQAQGINIKLETGGVAETVTINDTGSATLETENGNIDKQLTTEEIKSLPQQGRDPYSLLRLTPGIFGDNSKGGAGGNVALPNNPSSPAGNNRGIFATENEPQISANGQRVTANDYQIDGVSVNSQTHGGSAVITPNQESIKEIQVLSSTYSAEDGRNSGAQIKVVSQNGTNQFHGSAFFKYNSPNLNAFNKYGGPNSPPVRNEQSYKQFGGSLGGPIYLPRFGEGGPSYHSEKDKAFFFFSYEGLRGNSNNTFNNIVETPQFRQQVIANRPGSIAATIFSASGIQPRIATLLPATCAQFNLTAPGQCQAVGGGLDIGSLALSQGQYLPFSSLNGNGLDGIPDIEFAQINLPDVTQGNQYNGRVDVNLSSKSSLAISTYISRFTGVGSDAQGQSRPIGDIRTTPLNTAGTLTFTHIFNSTTVNEVRLNFTRFAFNEIQSAIDTNFGIPRIKIEDMPGSTNQVFFGAPQSETTPGVFAENTYEASDTLSKVMGNHGLKFGVVIRKEQDNDELNGGSRPLYSFAGLFNFANDAPLFYQINADPRTGGPGNAQRYFRTNNFAGFGQDDWKIRPNLTLNFGVRYEYFSPLREKFGQQSNIEFGSNQLLNAKVVVTDSLYKPDRNNFAPRMGFAWTPGRFDNKMVIRGGGGVSYNRIENYLFENTRGNPPFFARYQICCGTSTQDFSTPFNGGQILYALGSSNSPFSYPPNPALATGINPATGTPNGTSVEIYGALPKEPTPYVYTYSLEGQYELPYRMSATLGYQGSTSHKLVRLVNQNFLFPNNPAFFAVYLPTPDVNASYNALNARLTRRFGQGFQFDAIYRWSHSIDTLSNEGPGFTTNQTYPQDLKQERGDSDFDVRHSFVASGLWTLPFFEKRNDFVGKAFGGFQLSSIVTWHTGFPWTPLQNQCNTNPNRAAVCPIRPNGYFGGALNDSSNEAFIRPGGNFPGIIGNPTKYFVLGDQPPGVLPGIGRNSFRGPKYFDVDMTVSKRTGLPNFFGEGAYFEVKANMYNVFNTLNLIPFSFGSGNTIVSDPNFGRSPGGLAGRVVEFQARFSF